MKKILSLDDSVTMLQSVKITLKAKGYEVATFTKGSEALNNLTRDKYDLIITDLNMPEMDGITFIQKVRTIPSYKFTPILVLTTESQAAKKEQARKAGATAWITKPFTAEQLLMVVEKIVR